MRPASSEAFDALLRRGVFRCRQIAAVALFVLHATTSWSAVTSPDSSAADSSSLVFALEPRAGLPRAGATFGGTFADLDGDGRWDLVLSRHGQRAEVYLGTTGVRFRGPVAIEAPGGLLDHHGTAACDVDADGDWDLYLSTGADRGQSRSCKHLWRSVAPLRFEDATPCDHLLADPAGRGRGALWLAMDGDPRPGLLLLNFESPARLFRPVADEWTETTEEAFGRDPIEAYVAEIDDLDGDGRGDLLLAAEEARVWKDAGGRPTLVAAAWTVPVPALNDVAIGDVDGDGRNDVLMGLRGGALWLALNRTPVDGEIRFEAPRHFPDLPTVDDPVSLDLADLDNDGVLDLVVAQRSTTEDLPLLLARGRGDGTFAEPQRLRRVPSDAMAVWCIDLDRDGDLDLVALNGQDERRKGRGSTMVYENRSGGAGLTVELLAEPGAAPHGLGARVTLREEGRSRTRLVRSTANPWNSTVLPLHFGVGDRVGPFDLTVEWPDGQVQRLQVPQARAAYRVRAGASEVERVTPEP